MKNTKVCHCWNGFFYVVYKEPVEMIQLFWGECFQYFRVWRFGWTGRIVAGFYLRDVDRSVI